ncbi:HAD-IA family hydrolase [Parathalassolituus penaei]|uniref:HAD-IA family hydrolase n=1 Tax=Parathalassolituus penaei TaxID=2997323 RepID=A0A9X3IS07_9GAMM|nr:HAD-IA family hydrolase [Parathalassolituus penaei]MCY0965827.1 HAD-IA family hydrolase [Parathalassolituus penaei]
MSQAADSPNTEAASAPGPRAILFDLDGTLLDSAPDFYEVVNSLRRQDGLSELPTAQIREQVSNGGAALTCLTWNIQRDDPVFDKLRVRFLDHYRHYVGSASRLFPGFTAVLAELELLGIQWGIVTNKPRRFTEPLLAKLGINAPVVICADDVPNAKPAPDALLLAASKLDLEPQQCWYVGDHIRDIDAARNASMFSIAALFGYIESSDDPASWNADASIQRPDQLLTLLQQA